MENIKKIALITSASNFERQKNVVRTIQKTLKKHGNTILYVFTCYALFSEEVRNDSGEAKIYSLLESIDFDGCILEGNLGNYDTLNAIEERLTARGIPLVVVNFSTKTSPFIVFDSYASGCQVTEHLITTHNCKKINLVIDKGTNIFANTTLRAYQDTLAKHNIPFEEKRILYRNVSIDAGKELYHDFKKLDIDDAEAALFSHDIYAIGFCIEAEDNGTRIPEDIKICSLNRSTNSVVFRPDISGTDRMDEELAEQTCHLLFEVMQGNPVQHENYYSGQTYYGHSCGCCDTLPSNRDIRYQDIILSKVEAGNQISNMMHYNDSLEQVSSFDELGKNIHDVMDGIHCPQFFCCFNKRDLKYIINETDTLIEDEAQPFDKEMMALTGFTEREGTVHNLIFPLKELLPLKPECGDTFIFLPIKHRRHAFGYMVFVNELLPVEMYNYRICHESIGSSIENLHRQMVLKSSIEQLSILHMKDAMTGLYNRFGIEKFRSSYEESERYCVVVCDMDGLKKINDLYGHISGNQALCIVSATLSDQVAKEDLLIRYGGDEFLILSHNTDENFWENCKIRLNEMLEKCCIQMHLPYEMGISLGYVCHTPENPYTLEECIAIADSAMYENKKQRKACRE